MALVPLAAVRFGSLWLALSSALPLVLVSTGLAIVAQFGDLADWLASAGSA